MSQMVELALADQMPTHATQWRVYDIKPTQISAAVAAGGDKARCILQIAIQSHVETPLLLNKNLWEYSYALMVLNASG